MFDMYLSSNKNGFSQLIVDVVPGILDGHGAAAFAMGNDGNGFAGVTAQREQKGVKLLIVGEDVTNDVFSSFFCV